LNYQYPIFGFCSKIELCDRTAMFANVTATGGRKTLGIELDRDSVGPMIADDFGSDFRATSDRCRKGIDIGFGFLAGDS
jgi:hypothetical protein